MGSLLDGIYDGNDDAELPGDATEEHEAPHFEPEINTIKSSAGAQLATIFQLIGGGPNPSYKIQNDRMFFTAGSAEVTEADLLRICVEIHAELPARILTNDHEITSKDRTARPTNLDNSGTTALVAAYNPANTTLRILSLGDCRATLRIFANDFKISRSVQLNKEQKPDEEGEQKRIKRAGGEIVIRSSGEVRISNGERTASVAGAYGDYAFNGLMGRMPRLYSFNLAQEPVALAEDDIPVLFLESDGTVMDFTEEDRLAAFNEFLAQTHVIGEDGEPDYAAMCRHFNDRAVSAGSKDNITVMAVPLHGSTTLMRVAGVFDGHGTYGDRVAEVVSNTDREKLSHILFE